MPCCSNYIQDARCQCQHAKQCAEFREVLKPNGQLERAGATGAGQGRAAGVVCQPYRAHKAQWVHKGTDGTDGVEGCAPRLDALGPSPPNGGSADRIGGGRGALSEGAWGRGD